MNNIRRNKIGILNDMNWDQGNQSKSQIRSWTEIRPEEWRVLIENRVNKIPIDIELINVSENFESYIAILNPYGGVYPERDMVRTRPTRVQDITRYEFGTLNRIFEYVIKGGIFVNISDVPGYYAYDLSIGKSEVTTRSDNNFIQRLSLEQIKDDTVQKEKYMIKGFEHPNFLNHGKGRFLISSVAINEIIRDSIIDLLISAVREELENNKS